MRDGKNGWAKALAVLAVLAAILACSADPEVEPTSGPRVPLEEFVFPNEHDRLMAPALQLSQERSLRWTAEETAPYWRSPRALGIRWIEEESDRIIEALLETIP